MNEFDPDALLYALTGDKYRNPEHPPEPEVPDPAGPPQFVRWSAPLGTTCPICLPCVAEGVVPYGHVFSAGVTQPPAHPNCRCTLDVVEPVQEYTPIRRGWEW